MKKKKSAPKSRAHRELFTHDTPYGHKVQKDKSKVIPRKEKNKKDII
jgi:hypothetical protein|tara:strand:- start:1237 stop:1377 length:141 start_codon:yes stop_codon:yes gene_type:complete